MERTDAELIALARVGDKDAFGCLIERYERMVTRLVARMVSNHAVARELAQEALVQAYLSLDHLRDAERFESWLYGITLNVCRGYLRDEKAQALSLSVTAVKGRLHRARKQLREQLSSLYKVLPQERRRKRAMQPVTIHSVREHPTTQQNVVILEDDSNRQLAIWIGKPEAWAIASGLNEVEPPRPMAAQLMTKLLEATGAKLEEVRIDSLKDDIFYATLKVRGANGMQELDARPSDALSLAVLVKCPIFVADEVMQRVMPCPPWGDRSPVSEFRTLNREAIEKDQEERKAALLKVVTEMAELEAKQHKLEQDQAKQSRITDWKEERDKGPMDM